MYYKRYIPLSEDETFDDSLVTNSVNVKNASAKCIKTFKELTYEMEKVTDVLINLLEADKENSNNKQLGPVRRFKNDIENLKKYSMTELTVEKFQIDLKKSYQKLGDSIKEFDKVILGTAKRNNLEQLSVTAKRIPELTIKCFSAFNDFILASKKDADKFVIGLNKLHEKTKDNKEADIKTKKEVTQELLNWYIPNSFSLSEAGTRAPGFFQNLWSGVTYLPSKVVDLINKPYYTLFGGEELEKEVKGGWLTSAKPAVYSKGIIDDMTEGVNKMQEAWNKGNTNLDSISNFLTCQPTQKLIGITIFIIAAYWVYKKVVGKVRRWIDNLKNA